MLNKCHIQKDDKVRVLVGKDKGKIGKVLKILNKKQRIIVEKVNIISKY